MNTITYFYHLVLNDGLKRLSKVIVFFIIIVPSVVCAATVITHKKCYDYLPSDATPHGNFFICSSKLTGKSSLYACQNFISRYGHYRVFFKSGRYPKAIARVSKKGKIIRLLWSEQNSASRPEYNFQPPKLIPASSRFIGAGVCQNEQNQDVPCSAFRLNTARNQDVKDYLVFYKKDGTGPYSQTAITLEPNDNTMPAEMAYQIGLSLLDTLCCHENARQYLEYAATLFPDSTLYQTAVQQHQLMQ